MKKILLSYFIACIFTAASADGSGLSREGIEWCDVWITHADETNLPRVLLIGDSITRGYYADVEKRLGGKAYVARLTTSAFVSDPMLAQQIGMMLDNIKFDVIHFNNGMHGWQHSEAEYQKAFPGFLRTIQKHAPGAKLIWATTTPLKDSTTPAPEDPARASNARVAARNGIALGCLKGELIPVNDLFSLVNGHSGYYNDGVHFNREGIALQAGQVAACIEKLLPR